MVLELLILLALGVLVWRLGALAGRVRELEHHVSLLREQLQAGLRPMASAPPKPASQGSEAEAVAGVTAAMADALVQVPHGPLSPTGVLRDEGAAPSMTAADAIAAVRAARMAPVVPASPEPVQRVDDDRAAALLWPDSRRQSPSPASAGWGGETQGAADGLTHASPAPIGRVVSAVKNWFTTGNVPVKVGMLVLLAGLAALLRYAGAQGWVQVPMWARLAGVAAVALGGLALGWRQREQRPTFAVALQGGALGALLLTVFAAARLHGLMGMGLAFGLTVLLVAGVAVMATLQNALTLAALSVLAGFMAPIWLSTGSGNHVALFSYYAVLNLGIFAIAWMRPWRLLNLMGFAFTWGIGVFWGVLQYHHDKFASTEPFLLLFFAFYVALPILYARKSPAQAGDRIDGTLLFGTPLVAFSLQAVLLQGERWPLAGCALALALLYGGMAAVLRKQLRYAALGQVHAVLALGFATLAVPLAFTAQVTGCVFAMEGAALVWLGLRQHSRFRRGMGLALQAVASVLLMGELASTDLAHAGPAVLNARFMSCLLLALGMWATAWLYARHADEAGATRTHRTQLATLAYGWGLLCWLLGGTLEVSDHADARWQLPLLVLLVGVTGWLAAELQPRLRLPAAPALAWTSFAALVLGAGQAVLPTLLGEAWTGRDAVAWGGFALLGWRSMTVLQRVNAPWALRMHAAWLLLLPWVINWATGRMLLDLHSNSAWFWLVLMAPWLGMLVWSMGHWPSLRQPLGAWADGNRPRAQTVWFAVLGLSWLAAVTTAGHASPLPWLPVLNVLELLLGLSLLLFMGWLTERLPQLPDDLAGLQQHRAALLAAAVVGLLTASTLRTVHHWGGVPWDASLWSATLTQTALTVVWSLLGMVCWVMGSRRAHRGLWMMGAALMGVVLLKLLLVDRENLGDLLGIGAFLAYGVLCTVVGWLAPAPPKLSDAAREAAAVPASPPAHSADA